MTQPYIIFFRGLNGLIDETAAKQLASNRGCDAVFYPYSEWFEAAAKVVGNDDTPYHVVGFSRGAAPDIMGGFMKRIRALNARLPEDLMTVGLYGPKGGGFTPRYMDNKYDCINFLDSSGQRHAGEHNSVNLGANVPHLGAGGGMELVAKLFEGPGEYQLPPKPGSAVVAPATQAEVPASSGILLSKQDWPTQAHAMAFYGNPASSGWAASHLVSVPCPWELNMDGTKLHSIQIHRKCSESLARILGYIWEQSGKSQDKINELHYNLYSGSYNYRPMRGGTALSMHSYGAALDLDDQENQQHSHKHLFTENSLIVKAFEAESWTWGGRWAGASVDAMHFQASAVH